MLAISCAYKIRQPLTEDEVMKKPLTAEAMAFNEDFISRNCEINKKLCRFLTIVATLYCR